MDVFYGPSKVRTYRVDCNSFHWKKKNNKHRLIIGKVTVKECLAEGEFERCTTLVSCNTCQRVASSEIKVFTLLFL